MREFRKYWGWYMVTTAALVAIVAAVKVTDQPSAVISDADVSESVVNEEQAGSGDAEVSETDGGDSQGDGESGYGEAAPVDTASQQEAAARVTAYLDDAELPAHEEGTVLVSLEPGTTREQLDAIVGEVGGLDASAVTDEDLNLGLVELRITDATPIAEMAVRIGAVDGVMGAQPNYLYTLADDGGRDSDDADSPDTDSQDAEEADQRQGDSQDATEESQGSGEMTEAGGAQDPEAGAQESEGEPQDLSTQETVVNDANVGQQWGLASVNAFAAWDAAQVNKSVSVAVIDTGIDTDHEDLVGADGQVGTLDDNVVAWYNSETKTSTSTADVEDSQGHGTHVAGIISAIADNEVGVAGVSHNAGLVIIKASTGSTDSFETSTLTRAYAWLLAPYSTGSAETNAQHYHVRVINMSVGGKGDVSDDASTTGDGLLLNYIKRAYDAGILTVVAAGNASSAASVPYDCYPGDYTYCLSVINLTNQIGYASWNVRNQSGPVWLASSSNYNNQTTYEKDKDIAAPGTRIYSTVTGGSYAMKDGTSMASPMVAGIAALVYASGNYAQNSNGALGAWNTLTSTATDIGDAGWDYYYGYGEVNAATAVEAAQTSVFIVGPRQVAVGATQAYSIVGDEWTWSVSDASIATVDAQTGKLTGVKPGTVTLTVTNGSTTTTATIDVFEPTIDGPSAVFSGTTTQYTAHPLGLTWEWTASAVSNSTGGSYSINEHTGVLTVYGNWTGTITLTATCLTDSTVKVSKEVKVLGGHAIASSNDYLYVGLTSRRSVYPSDDGLSWQWATSDANVATIESATGYLEAKSAGTATVTAACATSGYEGVSLKRTVYVEQPSLSGDTEALVGGTIKLALDNPLNGYGYTYTWQSSDSGVATVKSSSSGTTCTVTGVASGTVMITLHIRSSEGYTVDVTHEVTVRQPVISGEDALLLGSSATYNLSPTTSNATWTWSVVSGSGAAIVDTHGVLTGTKAGTVTLRATCSDSTVAAVTKKITIVDASISGADSLYAGNSSRYTVASTPSGLTWQWSASGGTFSIGSTTGLLTASKTQLGSATVYATCTLGSSTLRISKTVSSRKYVTRLYGQDRFATMTAIVDAGFSSAGGTVVLACSDNFPDALTASALAGLADAPILITPAGSLNAQTQAELARLKPSTLIVCGGPVSISESTLNAAKAASGASRVYRLAGSTRSGTAADIYRRGPSLLGKSWSSDTVVIAMGEKFADALSIAPYCYAKGVPILLTEGSTHLSQETISALRAGGARRFIVVGGTSAVSQNVVNQLRGIGMSQVTRLSGAERYATSEAIAEFEVRNGLSASTLAIAQGENFPDALCGAALCGVDNGIILLVSGSNINCINHFANRYGAEVCRGYAYGGVNAIPGGVYDAFVRAVGS